MSRWIAFHVTERCPLSCLHCLRDPGHAPAELPLPLVERLLDEAGALHGIRHAVFTGGEPLTWPHLEGAVDALVAREFTWHLVTSGRGLRRLVSLLDSPPRRASLTAVDLSLDGATEATHDAIRGAGSHREVMTAVAALAARQVPFVLQMAVNARNEAEMEPLALLAAELGAKGVCYMMTFATGRPGDAELRLTPEGWDRVLARAERVATVVKVEVTIAEGFRRGDRFHVCEPYRSEALHVTPWGELSLCCTLSGVPGPREDVVADLHVTSLAEAHLRLLDLVHRLERERLVRIAAGPTPPGWDDFPCNRCLARFGKPHWKDRGEP